MIVSRRRLAALGLATVLTTALAGCGSDAAESPSGASPSASAPQTVVLYSGRSEELVGPLIEKFESASGVTVETRYGSTTEMAAQLLEEGDQTPAQVFLSQDAGALGAVAGAGLFTTLPAAVTGAVLPAYTSRDGSWVGLTGRARVIVYDGQQLTADQVPAEVTELTDPEWKGRVGIAPTNASFQAFVTALRVTEGEAAAEKWLTDLVANDVKIFEGNGPILEAVNAGTLDTGLINHYYWFETASEVGADKMRAQIAYGEPGSASALVNVTGAGVIKGNEQNAAANQLVAWLAGPEAQAYFVEQTHEYSLVPGAAGPAGAPAFGDLRGPDLDLADLASLDQTVALLQRVQLV
ncbi:MAG TPA: iron ABC transporter substrate-binding protein [Candidatus Nanopelagicales bacterium]|nr:iron ABC transporter substrate-binding protein [Candidatus Nanopelagicales bacterium]